MSKKQKQKKITTQSKSAISPVMVVGVAVGAVLLVVGLIILGNQSVQGDPVDESRFPAMGDPNAPVTITEFSDFG